MSSLFKFWKSYFLDQFSLHISMGGGGGGGPTQTTSTVQNTNIPEYARGYVENMLGATQEQLFRGTRTPVTTDPETGATTGGEFQITGFKPYQAYGGTYDAQGNQLSYDPSKAVAGFSPMQQAAQQGIGNMQFDPTRYNMAQLAAEAAGRGGLSSAQTALDYGAKGYQSGMAGQQLGLAAAAEAQALSREQAARANKFGDAGFASGQKGQELGIAGGQLGITGGAKYGEMGAGYGQRAAGLADTALGYGQSASDIGRMGLRAEQYGRQVSSQAEDYARQQAMAGQQYARMATDPRVTQALMNPYTQNVLDVQNRELQRQADIAAQSRGAQAVRAGAFGGGRQAIESAEAQRNLEMMKTANTAQALNQAYQQAQAQQQFGANLNLQGLAGAQQGLGTALQGGQLGLSGIGTALQGQQGALAGVGAANQAYQTGIQGAGMGLQGVNTQLAGVDRQLAGTAQGMQGAQVGLAGVNAATNAGQLGLQGAQVGLQGTAQGMQGAGMGLQGVQGAQAGYGLAGAQGANLTSMLGQQQQNQLGLYGAQNTAGAQQQALEQAKINQAMLDYANTQQYPLMQLGTMSNMLRGLPMQASTTNQYAASPNPLSQAVGTIGAGASIYNAFNPTPRGAAGGEVKGYAKGGIMSYDMGGEVESQLESMDEKELASQARESSSPTIRKMAQRLLRERQMSKQAEGANAAGIQYQAAQPQMPAMRGGGIIAFSQGDRVYGGPSTEKGNEDNSRVGMEERLAKPAPTTGGIMGAAPVTQIPTAPVGPLAIPEQEAMRQRDIHSAQANRATADVIKDIQAERDALGIGENKAREEYRSQMMAERANMADEKERQRNMRMAEFFASWGSTPGPVLVAGMNALKQSIPGIISDEKEAKKARREADKIIYDIDEATRLDKLGMHNEAIARREKAASHAEDYNKYLLTFQSQRESDKRAKEVAEISAKAHTDSAAITAAAHRGTSAAADKRADETIRYHMQQDTLAKKKAAESIDATIAKEAQAALDYKTAKRMSTLTRGVDKKERENALAIVKQYETDWNARKQAAKDDYDLAKDQLNEMNAKLGYSKKTESTTTPTPATTPAPAAAAPSVTIGGQTFTKPDNMTAAQWDAYKKSQGVK